MALFSPLFFPGKMQKKQSEQKLFPPGKTYSSKKRQKLPKAAAHAPEGRGGSAALPLYHYTMFSPLSPYRTLRSKGQYFLDGAGHL
ncbi:MAG: hypothetical protein ACI4XQ_08305 [Eubacteriales bacterium]